MRKYVILISHGCLAQGMHSVLDMFAGKRDDVFSISLEQDKSTADFRSSFYALIEHITLDDELLLFADILGGSPLTMSLEILSEKGMLEKTMIFTGMNLSACLTAVLAKETTSERYVLAEMIITEGKAGIQEYKLDMCEEGEEL